MDTYAKTAIQRFTIHFDASMCIFSFSFFWLTVAHIFAGTVPVVVGAPNIQDFAPSPGSLLHIKELKDIEPVAKRIKYLAENPGAYNESLR